MHRLLLNKNNGLGWWLWEEKKGVRKQQPDASRLLVLNEGKKRNNYYCWEEFWRTSKVMIQIQHNSEDNNVTVFLSLSSESSRLFGVERSFIWETSRPSLSRVFRVNITFTNPLSSRRTRNTITCLLSSWFLLAVLFLKSQFPIAV